MNINRYCVITLSFSLQSRDYNANIYLHQDRIVLGGGGKMGRDVARK